jgi:hypothetical protein
MGVPLFPGIEGGVTDPELPTQIANGGAGVGLANRVHDLFLREFRPLHRSTPFVKDRQRCRRTLIFNRRRFRGRRHDENFVEPVFQSAMKSQVLPWRRRLRAPAEEQLKSAPHAGGFDELLDRVVEGTSSATFGEKDIEELESKCSRMASWSGSKKGEQFIALQSATRVITIHPFRIITQ